MDAGNSATQTVPASHSLQTGIKVTAPAGHRLSGRLERAQCPPAAAKLTSSDHTISVTDLSHASQCPHPVDITCVGVGRCPICSHVQSIKVKGKRVSFLFFFFFLKIFFYYKDYLFFFLFLFFLLRFCLFSLFV